METTSDGPPCNRHKEERGVNVCHYLEDATSLKRPVAGVRWVVFGGFNNQVLVLTGYGIRQWLPEAPAVPGA